MLAALWLSAIASAPQDGPRVVVTNQSPVEQTRIVRVSLPFPPGAFLDLRRVRIAGDIAPCIPLLRWPDGSVQVAQAHARLTLPPGAVETVAVEPLRGAFGREERPATDWSEVPLTAELEDAWGRRFATALGPMTEDASLSSPRVRVFGSRRPLVRDDGDGETTALLAVRAWLVAFVGERRAELTLALENGLGDAPAAGPVRFRGFSVESADPELEFRPRWISENVLRAPEVLADGCFRQQLLGPSDELYLGDRTAKAFRFDLFADGPEVDAEARTAAAWSAGDAVAALPTLDTVRRSRAFAAHGGPAPTAGDTSGQAERLLREWRLQPLNFGPFGGFGDPRDAAEQGTPRNGPCALHNAVRWSSVALLAAARAVALQQSLRATPGCRPRTPADTAAYRQGLSPRAISRPHGLTPLDYEHFSVDLLYDLYWLTGDAFVRDELERAGRGLRPLLDGVPFMTARGEGWCLQGGVLIARATGDRELLEFLLRRAREKIIPALGGAPGEPFAIRQPAHPDALDGEQPFDAPWQMAALVHGLDALWKETGDRTVREAIVRVGRIMATVGWVDGVGPKYLVSANDEHRYQMPVGYSPTEGTAWMQLGAFVLAAEAAFDDADRSLFAARADFLVADYGDARPGGVLASPWFQIYFDRFDR